MTPEGHARSRAPGERFTLAALAQVSLTLHPRLAPDGGLSISNATGYEVARLASGPDTQPFAQLCCQAPTLALWLKWALETLIEKDLNREQCEGFWRATLALEDVLAPDQICVEGPNGQGRYRATDAQTNLVGMGESTERARQDLLEQLLPTGSGHPSRCGCEGCEKGRVLLEENAGVILESVRAAARHGLPASALFAGIKRSGLSLAQFRGLIEGSVRMKKIVVDADGVLYWVPAPA